MSLNDADALRQKLQENGLDAEQANGTMIVVDELVDHGIDRALGSIESLRSDMAARFDVIDKQFDLIEGRFDTIDKKFEGVNARVDLVDSRVTEKFDLLDSRLKTVAIWQPVKGAASTIVGLAAIFTFWHKLPDIIKLLS